MEKIFDEAIISYLKDSGVSEQEINKIKFKTLKYQSIKRLSYIIELIENNKFSNIKQYTKYSPSGDEYGCENNYIDFGFITGSNGLDIIELCTMLSEIKSQIKN